MFDSWAPPPGLVLVAIDLHEGLDVGAASMDDYRDVLARACGRLPRPVALCGWSMGGLVAMAAAIEVGAQSLVVIEPSPPAETQGTTTAPDVAGVFDGEEVYGAFPHGIAARPESLRARADRKRGIAVPALPGRTLVVYGDEFAGDRGRVIAAHYGVDEAHFPGLDHWGLVLSPRVRERIFDYVLGG